MEHYIDKKIERRSPTFLYMYRYFDNPTLYWQKFWEMVPSRFPSRICEDCHKEFSRICENCHKEFSPHLRLDMETLTEKREGTISQNFCQYNVGLSK